MKPCIKCGNPFKPNWLSGRKTWSKACPRCTLTGLASIMEEPCPGDSIADISQGEQVGASIREIIKLWTTDEKRVKLAEVCEWQDIHRATRKANRDPDGVRIMGHHPAYCENDFEGREYKDIPRYDTDLNACHQAEGRLNMGTGVGSVFRYQENLHTVVERDRHSPRQHVISATAAQRFHALGLTFNLWTENDL